MPDYVHIIVERDEHVGIVTLYRPQERNALNFQLISELINALEALDSDQDIRCIIITGAGEQAFETSLEEGLNIEHQNFSLLFASQDQREGMQAFSEKRKAEFHGK